LDVNIPAVRNEAPDLCVDTYKAGIGFQSKDERLGNGIYYDNEF